jgi:hypothetical protein
VRLSAEAIIAGLLALASAESLTGLPEAHELATGKKR